MPRPYHKKYCRLIYRTCVRCSGVFIRNPERPQLQTCGRCRGEKLRCRIHYRNCNWCGGLIVISYHNNMKRVCSDDCRSKIYSYSHTGWRDCYYCGKELEPSDWACQIKSPPGYCRDCKKKIFSNSRENNLGQFHCNACDQYLDPTEFWNGRRKCKACDYKQSRKFIKENPDKASHYRKKYKKSDLWKKSRHHPKNEAKRLSDHYVRKTLARYSVHPESWFTDEMVVSKREQLKLHRAIKGAKKAGIAK